MGCGQGRRAAFASFPAMSQPGPGQGPESAPEAPPWSGRRPHSQPPSPLEEDWPEPPPGPDSPPPSWDPGPQVMVSDPPGSMPDRDGEIAGRLRALAASPTDPESLRRGLLWVAGEVHAAEQAMRQANDQVAELTVRLAAVEAREQALARATAGIDSFRREFLWLSGEVQARGEALARATALIDDMAAELSVFRRQAGDRIANLDKTGLDKTGLDERGPAGDVRGELDRYAAEVAGTANFAEVVRGALRGGLLEDAVRELSADVERMAQELAAGQQATLAQVAGRSAPLEGALVELRRQLDRMAEEAEGVRSEVSDRVGAIDQRLQAVETLQDDLDGVYRELDRLSGHLSGGGGMLAQVAERLSPLEKAVAAVRQELLEARAERGAGGERVDEVTRRIEDVADGVERVSRRVDGVSGDVEGVGRRVDGVVGEVEAVARRIDVVGERIDMVEERVDMVGERVSGVDERLAALAVLANDVEGLYRELDRVAELSLSRDGALAQIADRTTPLEISVSALRQELDRLAGEVVVAQQAALGDVAERIDGVADRVGPLELLVDRVAELGHELRRVSEEAGSAQQAALAATTEQLGLAGRLRTLESLPSDIEGMYRDFERVAEAAAARDGRQGDVLERQAAVDAAIDDLRAEVERLASQGQSTELDLRRRLASLESLTTDLDSLYRELGRVTALTTDHEDRSAAFEATAASMRDSVAELRERIEDERIYTTEQVSGLWARMRAVEGVPGDIERVSGEIEKLADAVRRAFGDSSETLESVTDRVQALEALPTDLEEVQRGVDRLAEAARQRDEQITGLQEHLEPLRSALAEVRQEIERVQTDMASVGEARLTAIDDRVARLEGLPKVVDDALGDLTRASDEFAANHQASLASASVLLQDFSDRLRALEALPADMEGLYAALYRVAESVKALREQD
jgi:chromosome segregation ATPase